MFLLLSAEDRRLTCSFKKNLLKLSNALLHPFFLSFFLPFCLSFFLFFFFFSSFFLSSLLPFHTKQNSLFLCGLVIGDSLFLVIEFPLALFRHESESELAFVSLSVSLSLSLISNRRVEYWAIRSSARSFARTLSHSLPSLWERGSCLWLWIVSMCRFHTVSSHCALKWPKRTVIQNLWKSVR